MFSIIMSAEIMKKSNTKKWYNLGNLCKKSILYDYEEGRIMHENNGKIADNFIGIYPVSKTLRFELKPVGKTQEYIEKHGILDEDLKRAGDYKSVKK